MTVSERIVITGASGVVGTALLDGLAPARRVVGVDRRRPAHATADRPVRRGDLTRGWTARRALQGADVVVDLAARSALDTSWRTVHRNNMQLAWHTLEAARAVGARRVVLASSNHVVGGYERDEPYRAVVTGDRSGLVPGDIPRLDAHVTPRPDSAYAVGKLLAEGAARLFAESGLSVIVLRIGTVRASDRPETPRHLATLLTHRDLVQLVERAIDAPEDVRFGVFYGVLANTWRFWDIEAAREVLGYEPRDDAEHWRVDLAADRPGGPIR